MRLSSFTGGLSPEGLGGAVRDARARTPRVPRRALRLTGVGAAVIVVGAMLLVPSSDNQGAAGSSAGVATPTPPEEPPMENPPGWSGYALASAELDGLPGEIKRGADLQIWVAWDPPVTRRSQVQLLVPRATFGRVIPPIVPGAPATVEIALPDRHVPDLIYGDRYGALSVVVPGP